MPIYPICHACGKVPNAGLYDGFRLHRGFICSNCRDEMVSLEIGCQRYEQFKDIVRGILFETGGKNRISYRISYR